MIVSAMIWPLRRYSVGFFLGGVPTRSGKTRGLDRMLGLFGGKLRELQCGRRERDKAVGMRSAEFGQLLVLDADQLGRGIAFRAVPKGVDAERLDIDARLVHVGDAVADIGPQEPRRLERVIDDLCGIRNDAMRMHVDRLDALAGDDNLPAPRVRMRVCAASATGTGRRAG